MSVRIMSLFPTMTISNRRWALIAIVLAALVSTLVPLRANAAYVPGDSGWGLWDTPPAHDIFAVWADPSSDNVFAVGAGGRVFHYDGATWTTINSSTTNDLVGVWGSSSNDVFAVGSNGAITHYNGSTWQTMTSNASHLSSIWGDSGSDVFAVGNQAFVMHYNGTSWTSMPIPSVQLRGVWGSSPTDVFAVGNVGTILHYDGTNWTNITPSPSITNTHLYGVWGSSPTDVFAVGAGGTICHFNGTTWNLMPSNTTSTLYDVWGTSPSDVFAVGASGRILHYDGSSWTSMASGTSKELRGINGRGPLDVFAVGKSGAILHYLEQAPPELSLVEPGSGIQGDTLQFTITGNDLSWASDVSFGAGISVDNFTVTSPTTITGELTIDPLADIGPRGVSVTTHGGTDVLPDGFIVNQAPPAIAVVDPATAIQGASLQTTITGTYLDGTSSVSFGSGITVNSFTQSGGSITAEITIAPDAITGPRNITVVTPGGTTTKTNSFTVAPAPPTLVSIEPGQACMGEYLTVTLNGTYLTGTTALDFGLGIQVNHFDVVSPGQMTVQITIASEAEPGPRNIEVWTPGGTATLTQAFTVTLPPAPSLLSVSPDSANQGETLDLVITGTGFTTATSVSLGDGISVNSFVFLSDTTIQFNITVAPDAASGMRNVSVVNPGGHDLIEQGFEVPPPSLLSIDCASGHQGDTMQVTIFGKNLSGASNISFGPGITVESFTVDGPDQLTALIRISNTARSDANDIVVTTPNGTTTLSGAFTVDESSAMPVHTWILSGLVLGLIGFRTALFGLYRRRCEDNQD